LVSFHHIFNDKHQSVFEFLRKNVIGNTSMPAEQDC